MTSLTDRLNGIQTSLAIKAPCAAVATSNITLSGEQTVNGVSVTDGDRVLVVGQTDASKNGIYVVSTSAWTRAADFDGNRDVRQGTICIVYSPTGSSQIRYQVTSANPIVIGTSNITFQALDAPNITYPQTAAESNAGVTPSDKRFPEGHVERYGDVTTDVGAAANTAFSVGRIAKLPARTDMVLTTQITVPAWSLLVGAGPTSSVIDVQADVVGVLLKDNNSQARDFEIKSTVAHTKNGIEVGENATTGGGFWAIDKVKVGTQGGDSFGNDGIHVKHGNRGMISDVQSLGNGNDGLHFANGADSNAIGFSGVLDLRGNSRDGLHFAEGTSASDNNTSRQCHGGLIAAQANGRYGAFIGTRSHVLDIYAESNPSGDLVIGQYATELDISTVAGNITNNANAASGNNIRFHNGAKGRTFIGRPVFQDGSGGGLMLLSNDNHVGTLELYKTADRAAVLDFGSTSSNQTFTARNSSVAQNLFWNIEGAISNQRTAAGGTVIGDGNTGTLISLAAYPAHGGTWVSTWDSGSNIGGVAFVFNDGTNWNVLEIATTGSISFSMSGTDLQLTNNTGGTIQMRTSDIRIA